MVWPCTNGGSAVFCLWPKSGFIAKQWVGEESKSPESGRTPDSVGVRQILWVGVGMMPGLGMTTNT
jgi:hypothetical protein